MKLNFVKLVLSSSAMLCSLMLEEPVSAVWQASPTHLDAMVFHFTDICSCQKDPEASKGFSEGPLVKRTPPATNKNIVLHEGMEAKELIQKTVELTIDELNQAMDAQMALRDALQLHGEIIKEGKLLFEKVALLELVMLKHIGENTNEDTQEGHKEQFDIAEDVLHFQTQLKPIEDYQETLFEHMRTLREGQETQKVTESTTLYQAFEAAHRWSFAHVPSSQQRRKVDFEAEDITKFCKRKRIEVLMQMNIVKSLVAQHT